MNKEQWNSHRKLGYTPKTIAGWQLGRTQAEPVFRDRISLPPMYLDIDDNVHVEIPREQVNGLEAWCRKTGVPFELVQVQVTLIYDKYPESLYDRVSDMGFTITKDKRRNVRKAELPKRPESWAKAVDLGSYGDGYCFRWVYAEEKEHYTPVSGASRSCLVVDKHIQLRAKTEKIVNYIEGCVNDYIVQYGAKVQVLFDGDVRGESSLWGLEHDSRVKDINPATDRRVSPGDILPELNVEDALVEMLAWMDARPGRCVERTVVRNQLPLPW